MEDSKIVENVLSKKQKQDVYVAKLSTHPNGKFEGARREYRIYSSPIGRIL